MRILYCQFNVLPIPIAENFAKHLYTDLQAQGIQRQEKILLLISEHALKSTWIEVEAALEYERIEQRKIFFPVRLDESITQTAQSWAAKLQRQRHIGDFTRWAKPQAYQQAFKLGDLHV